MDVGTYDHGKEITFSSVYTSLGNIPMYPHICMMFPEGKPFATMDISLGKKLSASKFPPLDKSRIFVEPL